MDLKAIGARIKDAREAANMTQETLAEKVGISRTHISVIERGVKAPKLETFVVIANVLGVSADTLLFSVVDKSCESVASELSIMIEKLPQKERERKLEAIRMLLQTE